MGDSERIAECVVGLAANRLLPNYPKEVIALEVGTRAHATFAELVPLGVEGSIVGKASPGDGARSAGPRGLSGAMRSR